MFTDKGIQIITEGEGWNKHNLLSRDGWNSYFAREPGDQHAKKN
jgi:hypothetical protein